MAKNSPKTAEKKCDCSNKDRGWIPQNSVVKVSGENSLAIRPPVGFKYIGYNKNGVLKQLAVGSGISVSCECLTAEKCSPFLVISEAGTTTGCAGVCELCLMEVLGKIGNNNILFETGGFIDLTQNVEFVRKGLQLPAAFDAMFQLDEVKQAIASFAQEVYQGLPYPELRKGKNFATTPKGYSMAAINVFGRMTAMPVPTIALNSAGGSGGTTVSCSCTEGECELNSVNELGIEIYSCTGSCTGTCTLETSVNQGNGNINITYSATAYRF